MYNGRYYFLVSRWLQTYTQTILFIFNIIINNRYAGSIVSSIVDISIVLVPSY